MTIGAITSMMPNPLNEIKEVPENNGQFENIFTDLIKSVNTDQLETKKITEDFLNGKGVELHEVMIADEKAKTSLDLLMEIRNKTINMYQELIKLSV